MCCFETNIFKCDLCLDILIDNNFGLKFAVRRSDDPDLAAGDMYGVIFLQSELVQIEGFVSVGRRCEQFARIL